jgi:hypothetical protein
MMLSWAAMTGKPIVFVSCGQFTEAERQLGKEICLLVEALHPQVEAYFAQNQSTVEGLSANILKALHEAAGFICVMHSRGKITTPDGKVVVRGSVWVEQEIAIAAFMHSVLAREFPIFFYCQEGISLEGIRSVLLANPRLFFTNGAQVLKDLRLQLLGAIFTPRRAYEVEPIIAYRQQKGRSNGDRHVYDFICDVKNVGAERVTDFLLRIHFPRNFLPDGIVWAHEEKKFSTPSHVCFQVRGDRAPDGLYPGEGLQYPFEFDYFVNTELHDDPEAMRSEIVVELFSGSMPPKKYTLPITKYQNF